jgi:hypothetical protein
MPAQAALCMIGQALGHGTAIDSHLFVSAEFFSCHIPDNYSGPFCDGTYPEQGLGAPAIQLRWSDLGASVRALCRFHHAQKGLSGLRTAQQQN